jgi:hypothetical protein
MEEHHMKRSRILSMFLGFVVMLGAVTAYSHHSVAALYDASKTIKIEGKLISFSFRSPHSSISVETKDAKGAVIRWDVAWNAARELQNTGINRQTFKPGDVVIITGNPGRKPEDHIIKMVSFLRPADGLTWGGKPGETFQ